MNWYSKYTVHKKKFVKAEEMWGTSGSGVMFVCPEDQTTLLLLRSESVQEPNTWGIPGGALSGTEGIHELDTIKQQNVTDVDLWESAKKETLEEVGYFPKEYKIVGRTVFKKGNFQYTTFIVAIPLAEKTLMQQNHALNWENVDLNWFGIPELSTLQNKHFGVDHILDNYDFKSLKKD